MKILKITITALSLFTSLSSFADQVQTMKGLGIDGKPCSVTITRDGNSLKSVQLKGASQVFEILAENGGSYGPKTDINPRGAEEIFSLNEDQKYTYEFFTHSENIMSSGEVFKFNTNDIPPSATSKEKPLKGINMVIQLGLNYEDNQLVRVRAQSKMKAFWLATMASSQFICEK